MGSGIVTKPSYYSRILFLSIPIILQQLLRVSVDVCDSMVLGQVDQIQMAAISQAQQIFFVFYTICNGFAVGACVLIAQYWGKKAIDEIRTLTAIGVRAITLFAAIVTVIVMLFPERVMGLYSSDPVVIDLAAPYLRMVALMYIPCAVSVMLFACYRGVEQMKISFIVNVVSYPLNLLLDYSLILGKFGLPALGMTGGAIGTIIARYVEFAILVYFALRVDKNIHLSIGDLRRRDKRLTFDFIKVSVPLIAHETIWSIGTTAGSFITGHLGTTIVAGYNVAYTMYNLLACVMNGTLHACSVVMGMTIGRGSSKEQIHKEANTMILIGFVYGCILGGLTLLLRGPFVGIYELTEETRRYALGFAAILAAIWPFSGMEMTGMIATLRAGGDGKTGFISDIFTMWIFTIPPAAAGAFLFNWSPYVVISIIKFNIVLEASVGIWRIQGMKWVKNLTSNGA